MFVNTILKEKRLSSLKREFLKEDPINICRENSRCHHKVRKQILLGEIKDTHLYVSPHQMAPSQSGVQFN